MEPDPLKRPTAVFQLQVGEVTGLQIIDAVQRMTNPSKQYFERRFFYGRRKDELNVEFTVGRISKDPWEDLVFGVNPINDREVGSLYIDCDAKYHTVSVSSTRWPGEKQMRDISTPDVVMQTVREFRDTLRTLLTNAIKESHEVNTD